MSKDQILDEIRSRFLKALDENYESFSISLDKRSGLVVMRVSGAYEGYKAFSYDLMVDPNGRLYGPGPHEVEELERKKKR